MPGAPGRGRPGRPGEERRQLVDLLRVLDRIRPKAVAGCVGGEKVPIVSLQLGESRRLLGGKREGLRVLVVAVGLELVDRCLTSRVGLLTPKLIADRGGGAVQVVGGEVRPQVCPVTEDRAVLHEPVMKEDLLALADVVARVDDPPAGIDRPLGDRRIRLVGPIGEQDEDEETGENDEPGDLDPCTRDEQLAFPGWVASRRRASGLFSSVLPHSRRSGRKIAASDSPILFPPAMQDQAPIGAR